jgi:hypothetical protein
VPSRADAVIALVAVIGILLKRCLGAIAPKPRRKASVSDLEANPTENGSRELSDC